MKNLQLKITLTDFKNSMDGLNSRMEMSEERISELKENSIEMIQSEQQREKRV